LKTRNTGEFGLISRIAAQIHPHGGVITGIGDDAAVTALNPEMQLVTSTDMLLEDIHFRRRWHDPYRLGRKSLAVSISDLAAMGSLPRWALLSLAIPADLPPGFIDTFTCGFLAMAEEHSVTLIGGDTCASRSGLVISVTIAGEQLPELIVRRSGARPDDDIWVSGTLGDAALGLKLLDVDFDSAQPALPGHSSGNVGQSGQSGRSLSGVEGVISRLLDPTPRVAAGLALAASGLVTAMIDISDGLLADFGHIAELSGVGGRLQLDAFPLSAGFREISAMMSEFPHELPLSGGEDYELCFTASSADREKIIELIKKSGNQATVVGIVSRLPGVTVLHADGSSYTPLSKGFNHFISTHYAA
jgi:thiamine-monophosphate kinase